MVSAHIAICRRKAIPRSSSISVTQSVVPSLSTRFSMQCFIVAALLCAVSTIHAADIYQSYPLDSVKHGKEEYLKIKDAAQTESVVDYIFGTDCYSRAVRSLDKGCKHMTAEEHATLAFLITNCFLDNSGRRTIRCSGTQIRDCTSAMDEETFSTYQHFFINIYNICIFLENDNFQKQTEHLVQQLYRSTNEVFGKMMEIRQKIENQEGQLKGVSSQVAEVGRMQRLVEEGVSRGIQEVVALQKSTATLEEQMSASLQVENLLYDRQQQLLEGHEVHEKLEATRASRVEAHFQMFEEFQERMMDWQHKYQELQEHLLASSETLMTRSNDLQGTLVKLLDYEAKTEKAIRQVLGRSFKGYDLAVYIIGMVVGLSLGNMKKTHAAGGPVFAVFCSGLLIHRFLSDTWSQANLFDYSDGGWFSMWMMVFGPEFRVGWLIQCLCICVSAFLVTRVCFLSQDRPAISSDQFYTLSKQLKRTERYMKSFAAEQKRLDAYIEKRLEGVGNQPSPFRFAGGQGVAQTAFQRHLSSIASPHDFGCKARKPCSPSDA